MTRRHRGIHAVFWLVAGPLGLLALVMLVLNRPRPAAHSDLPLSTVAPANGASRAIAPAGGAASGAPSSGGNAGADGAGDPAVGEAETGTEVGAP